MFLPPSPGGVLLNGTFSFVFLTRFFFLPDLPPQETQYDFPLMYGATQHGFSRMANFCYVLTVGANNLWIPRSLCGLRG